MAAQTTLILGGARSGKSWRAQRLAESLGPRRAIVVTAEAFDAEMQLRIEQHRADRDATWHAIEAPHDLMAGLAEACLQADVVLVDCLTLWLSNLLLAEKDLMQASDALIAWLGDCPVPTILVSNEVGSGVVPESPLGRRFRDDQGRLNQRIADAVAQVELVVAGQVLVIKS